MYGIALFQLQKMGSLRITWVDILLTMLHENAKKTNKKPSTQQ